MVQIFSCISYEPSTYENINYKKIIVLRLRVTISGRGNSANSPVNNFRVDAYVYNDKFCWSSSMQRQLAIILYEKWESYCSRKARYEATYSQQKSPVLQTLALRVAALKMRAQVTEVRSKSLSRCCLPFS